MKKIIKYIMLFTLSVYIYSCVSIDEDPEGQISPENFYSDVESMDAAVIGCYSPLFGGYGGYDFKYGIGGSLGSEELKHKAGNVLATWDELRFHAEDGPISTIWKMYYVPITNANAVIDNLNLAENIPQNKLDEFEGQARFMRAFSYFNLVQYFGEIPIVTYETQSQADQIGQSPVSEVYAFIIQDLEIAEEKLPVSFEEVGRANKAAAKALLAKVYLTMAGWPIEDPSYYALARDKAKEVMDMGTYKLENNFADLWLVENKLTNTEFMFTLQGIGDQGSVYASHLHIATRPSAEGGWANFFSEERFLNAFPEGPRKDATFHLVFTDGTNWQDVNPQQPFIGKWRDGGSATDGANGEILSNEGDGFWVYLRYADVLLMYAEAANMAEGGPSAQALEAINKVRRRAMGMNKDTPNSEVDLPSGTSQSDFDDAVIAERAWELAFENNRWFDLVRKKMVVEVNKDLYPYVTEQNRLFPKPLLEVQLTEGLEQNPGY